VESQGTKTAAFIYYFHLTKDPFLQVNFRYAVEVQAVCHNKHQTTQNSHYVIAVSSSTQIRRPRGVEHVVRKEAQDGKKGKSAPLQAQGAKRVPGS